jgi:hypothetical protein
VSFILDVSLIGEENQSTKRKPSTFLFIFWPVITQWSNFTTLSCDKYISSLLGWNQTHNLSGLGVMVFNATFNNISAISLWSVLLEEETEVPRENHWSATGQKINKNVDGFLLVLWFSSPIRLTSNI